MESDIYRFLVALGVIDFFTMRLPDALVLPFLGIGFLNTFIHHSPTWSNNLISALGVGGVFYIISKVRPQGMGYGDAKYLAALGVWLGYPKIVLAIFVASLMGSIVGVAMVLARRANLREQIPFGPYLSFGACIAFFGGDQIFNWLLNLVLT